VAGLELNEHFWKEVAAVDPEEASYEAVALAVGRRLADGDYGEYNNGAFLNECGEYLLDWVACLDALAESEVPATADD
jgi:hypothetical protein